MPLQPFPRQWSDALEECPAGLKRQSRLQPASRSNSEFWWPGPPLAEKRDKPAFPGVDPSAPDLSVRSLGPAEFGRSKRAASGVRLKEALGRQANVAS